MAALNFDEYEEGFEEEDELDGRTYRRRVRPFKEFGRRKFRKRFRLTKRVTRHLADDFYNFVPVQGEPNGGAIPIEDRVSMIYIGY